MTTRGEISNWFDNGSDDSRFMIIVHDTFDGWDYPVYTTEKGFEKVLADHDSSDMQTVMEVYDLTLDKESQLNLDRCRADQMSQEIQNANQEND